MDSRFFVSQAKDAFSFLSTKYGFSMPEIESLGREVYVRFHRNNETVSVSLELGSEPIIELFLLCEGTVEKPVPWAERNGKARFRRIVNLRKTQNFFINAPKEFEEIEHEWLQT